MNLTYLHVYDILDNAEFWRPSFSTHLGRNEELVRKKEAVETSREDVFAKIQDENKELKNKLRDSQVGLQALANDYTAVTTKVSVIEAKARAAEERAAEEEFVRDAAI